MAQGSGVLAVLVKDLSLEPSTHIRLFTADCNSRSRGFNILLGTLRALTKMLRIYTYTHTGWKLQQIEGSKIKS